MNTIEDIEVDGDEFAAVTTSSDPEEDIAEWDEA